MKIYYAILLLMFAGCSKHASIKTGFYYLSPDKHGIEMSESGSGKIYYLEQEAFASVDHIASAAIEETKTNNDSYRELCMQFDSKGTMDFQNGTDNPQQRPIAVVVVNRLFYVISKSERITTGKVCIYANDISYDELLKMKKQIESKQ